MKTNSRWTEALANQYSASTLRRIPYAMIIVLLICIALMLAGRASWGFSLLTLDFFMLADYLTVKLAQKNINVIFSMLLGTLISVIVTGIVILGLGLLFKW